MASGFTASGANMLRSSQTRNYGAKTLEGNWVDNRKLTSFEGTRPTLQTEVQIRNAESEWHRRRVTPRRCGCG